MRYRVIACAAVAALMSASALSGAAWSAETDTWNAKEEVMQVWNGIKTFSIERKNDAVKAGHQFMDEVDRRIDALQAKASEMKADASADWEKDMERVREMRAAAAEKLDRLADGSAETWKSVKEGFGDAMGDLADTLDKAQSDYADTEKAKSGGRT